MKPLQWPPSLSVTPRKWFQSLFSPDKEYQEAVEYIKKQLIGREEPDIACWGNSPLRFRVAKQVCTRVQEWYQWPNDYFIPEDPFEILFLVPWDELDVFEVALQLQDDLNIKLNNPEIVAWQGKTLGNMIDTLVNKF